MTKTLKIIIASISILIVLSTGIYFLNKELPGCFSPKFLSKIKTDVGCFELIKYNVQGNNYQEQQAYIDQGDSYKYNSVIVNATKDYYKKVRSVVSDNEMKVIVGLGFLGLGSTDYISINLHIESPWLDKLNPEFVPKMQKVSLQPDPNKIIAVGPILTYQNIRDNLGYFEGEYLIDKSKNSSIAEFSGFYNFTEERRLVNDIKILIYQKRNENFKFN